MLPSPCGAGFVQRDQTVHSVPHACPSASAFHVPGGDTPRILLAATRSRSLERWLPWCGRGRGGEAAKAVESSSLSVWHILSLALLATVATFSFLPRVPAPASADTRTTTTLNNTPRIFDRIHRRTHRDPHQRRLRCFTPVGPHQLPEQPPSRRWSSNR